MTIWSKLLPVGAAEAVAGKERSMIPIEGTRKGPRGLSGLVLELSHLFSHSIHGFGFPALTARDSFSVGAKNQTLCVERVPGKIHYTLKIQKSNAEPDYL